MRLAAKLFIFLPCVAAMFAQIPVTINTASPLPPATNFQGYSQPIIATGGGGSYLWSEVRPASGTDPNCPGPLTGLPPGLTVSASAQAASASVGIRPISSGDWTFCVQADDNAGSVARKQFQLRVNAEPIVNLANTVTVAAGTPAITGVNPNTGRQGTNNLNVAIAGQFTNWAQGSTTVNLGAGITVNSVTVGGQPAGAGFASQVLADNPKGFWFLNDVPGTPTTAIDSSVSAFNGTYGPGVTAHGIAGPSWVPPSGLVANFTGGTISFPSLLNLGSSGYTIEAWINPSLSSLTQTTRIVASGSGLNGYGFGTAAGGGLVFTSFSRQDYVTTGLTLLPNQWQYVGVVLDASSDAHFYVNGSLVESVAGALATLAPTGNFTIGNQSPGVGHTDEIFTGGLAGISVYDSALTSAQILGQYNAAQAVSATPEPVTTMLIGSSLLFLTLLLVRHRKRENRGSAK